MAAQQYVQLRSSTLRPKDEARTHAKAVELGTWLDGELEGRIKSTYMTPKLMRAHTAILFLIVSVRRHTTAIGRSVQTTSAKTETAT